LPYENDSVEKIYLFHAIEHIPEAMHENILTEFYRVLVPNGLLVISYPEFRVCAHYWAINHRGLRDFWKATIYGRQLHPGDFHVTLMDTPTFLDRLKVYGFDVVENRVESGEEYNSVIKVKKGRPMMTYEDVLRREIFGE
jgi:predicted SAM-dependent methyltransferase